MGKDVDLRSSRWLSHEATYVDVALDLCTKAALKRVTGPSIVQANAKARQSAGHLAFGFVSRKARACAHLHVRTQDDLLILMLLASGGLQACHMKREQKWLRLQDSLQRFWAEKSIRPSKIGPKIRCRKHSCPPTRDVNDPQSGRRRRRRSCPKTFAAHVPTEPRVMKVMSQRAGGRRRG